ncbi:probable E3 ubiquitin-protein ligase ARI8 [Cryptomeria japonica]|uniref:probable E3 ubiquitin-protein ligase ARI8 n=1 Tax=Cryptomeria japonica TaxID=3369 RepID=UPI0027DAAE3F|nr:probable E3 ubiquitin-protein ligase ARI8 [Cryptomeria japonica]
MAMIVVTEVYRAIGTNVFSVDGKDDLHHNQGEDEEYTSDKYFCDSDELEDENHVTDFFEQEHHEKKINIYTVVKEEDICQRQEEGMRVIDEWLVKEEIRRDLGLFKTGVSEVKKWFFLYWFLERKKTIKWCPAPGCEYAVEVGNHGSGSGSYEVTCECCYEFCWNCLEEAHGPVDCEIAKKSMLENNDFGKTENWKLVNTKRCPKCNSAIEKGGGCRHMTCVFPCCFEFCLFCLGNWFDHDAHYACDWYYDS